MHKSVLTEAQPYTRSIKYWQATVHSHGSNLERAQEQRELVRSTPDLFPFSSISTMGGRLRTAFTGAP